MLALTRVSAAGLFSKFPKMARGLATQLGKQVEVIVEGEDTEFDKALIDDLDAALTHLVRNVMDHGLESPEERTRAGKSPVGKLWLTAEQTRTHTLITVRDNGRGIDANRVRRKAVEKERREKKITRRVAQDELAAAAEEWGMAMPTKAADDEGEN